MMNSALSWGIPILLTKSSKRIKPTELIGTENVFRAKGLSWRPKHQQERK